MITQAELNRLFDYSDGQLIRKVRAGRRGLVGKAAGKVGYKGYMSVKVNHGLYKVHRLVFLMHHGYLPDQIDHIDGNRSNNRIENLRPATASQNTWNSKRNCRNTSGIKGVTWSPWMNQWRARCGAFGKRHHVGYFKTKDLAAEAVAAFRQSIHGEYAHD